MLEPHVGSTEASLLQNTRTDITNLNWDMMKPHVGSTEAPLLQNTRSDITDLNWDMLEPHVGSTEAKLLGNTRTDITDLNWDMLEPHVGPTEAPLFQNTRIIVLTQLEHAGATCRLYTEAPTRLTLLELTLLFNWDIMEPHVGSTKALLLKNTRNYITKL